MEEKEEGEVEGVNAGHSESAPLPLPEIEKDGITQTVISSAMDVLMKHSYLRVRLADDCGLKRHVCVLKLEALLDALCVQQVGSSGAGQVVGKSITLYRQPGLPRPSNCPSCVVLGSQATLTKMAKVAKVKRMAAKKPPGTDEVHRDRPPELQVLATIPKEVQQAVPKEKENEKEKREEKEEGEEEGVNAGHSESAPLPLPEIGKHGLTQTVISSAMDVLMKHPYVSVADVAHHCLQLRVRLADDCGLERREGVLKLEALLDAVCVQQVGHTITLYRQPGLPRPSNCPSCVVLGSQAKVTKAAKLAEAKAKRMAAKKPPGTDEVHRDRPPELQVLA
ncbi:hypothetical protein QJQ45_026269 [Haematococcus lacustris]|nr:hypothetical protein QJQ45_026269 [Haematococcus lacustris]